MMQTFPQKIKINQMNQMQLRNSCNKNRKRKKK